MTKVNARGDMRHTKGDTFIIKITPLSSAQPREVYRLDNGEYATLFVRFANEIYLSKTVSEQGEDGELVFEFSAAEMNLHKSVYIYDCKLYSADGAEIDTFIGGDKSPLTLEIV